MNSSIQAEKRKTLNKLININNNQQKKKKKLFDKTAQERIKQMQWIYQGFSKYQTQISKLKNLA